MDKQALLDKMQYEADWWENFLDEVGEDRMVQPGATEEWSFKDVVAHISAWRTRTLARLEAARHDRVPNFAQWPAGLDEGNEEDLQQLNQWIYEENRDRPLDDILNESRQQFRQMSEVIRRLPEEKLFDPHRFEWMEGLPVAKVIDFSFEHVHEEHEPLLRKWLAQMVGAG